jgi:Transglycosylase SLT domain
LDRLHFGARARRRARLKRLVAWAAAVSVAAILLGVPGSDAGLRFVEEALSGNSAGISVSSGVGLARSTTPPQRLRKRSDADAKLPARETPTPTSADATPSSPEKIFEEGTITDIILNAAAAHGVSGDFLYSLAMCESTLNPNAYNPAGYHGLFQFDFQTWAAFGEGHIYDPEAQAQAAAELISAGETDRWPNCP